MSDDTQAEIEHYIWNDVVDQWQRGQRTIDSQAVQQRMGQAGVLVNTALLDTILTRWQTEQRIQATYAQDSEASYALRAMTITWVDTTAESPHPPK